MFHCDEHYLDGVCVYQGKRDVMEDRNHRMCSHEGRNDRDVLCRHCMEHKKQFRAKAGSAANRIRGISRIRIVS